MRYFILIIALLGSISVHAQEPRYRVDVDIANVHNDRVLIAMWPPRVDADTATFVFPVTIPGTYQVHNWWKLVRNFRAIDTALRELPVHRSADSQFVVKGARGLRFVSYELLDSFDDTTSGIDIFCPAGTDFEADSIFVLNHGGIVCYIDGIQKIPFQINIKKPKHLFGGSALNIARISDTLDTYIADSYDHLVDNPVLYSLPDTATFVVAGVKVLVHCAHSGKDRVAPAYAKELAKLTKTISRLLPSMPVNRYAFLFYLWRGDLTKVARPSAMGALEHSHSSFYFLRYQTVPIGLRDVAVHEFLHILVPLNLHSEQIDQFDFRNPKMSQHLWLYEGTTEYFATLAPLNDSTIKEESFRRTMESKLKSIEQLPEEFSFTEFSKGVLQPKYQSFYPLVYTYGAVNAFYLDILIRHSTGRSKGLLSVLYSLMREYGPRFPFKDDQLFSLIEKETNAEVRAYLDDYVSGTKRLPSASILEKIGWKYVPERTTQVVGYGFSASFVQQGDDFFAVLKSVSSQNPLGVKDGDHLIKIEGVPLAEVPSSSNGSSLLAKMRSPKLGDVITITVERNKEELELSAAAVMVDRVEKHFIEADPMATPQQLALRKSVFWR